MNKHQESYVGLSRPFQAQGCVPPSVAAVFRLAALLRLVAVLHLAAPLRRGAAFLLVAVLHLAAPLRRGAAFLLAAAFRFAKAVIRERPLPLHPGGKEKAHSAVAAAAVAAVAAAAAVVVVVGWWLLDVCVCHSKELMLQVGVFGTSNISLPRWQAHV